MLRTHNHINSLIRRAAGLLLALSLAVALPALPTPAGGGAEAYAKGNLAAGDTVKNVLVYVMDSEENDVLLSRLNVADMLEYLNDNMDAIGRVHNYSILDNFVTSVHQEAQGFTVPQLLDYAVSKSPVESAPAWGLGFSGSDSVSFWEIDGGGFDGMDTYTYDNLYGVDRYNFPAMYANFIPGSLNNFPYRDKGAVWDSREPEDVVLSITAYSERYMSMVNRSDPPAGNAENYFDDHGLLDTARTMRVMLPLTKAEFDSNETTANNSRYGITYIRFVTSSAPSVTSAGVVEKPTWTVIDGDEDGGDEYEDGYAYFTFSCATTGASILYNDTSNGSYMPTALYEGQPLKVEKSGGVATINVRAVKEGWADKGVIRASSTGNGGEDEYSEYVSPDADIWDGISSDTLWYDGHESESSYEIGTAAQLAGLAELTNDGIDFEGKTVTLTRDIHLAGKPWRPIADDMGRGANNGALDTWYVNYFNGTFDGGGHTVSGIRFRASSHNGEAMGLFGYQKEKGIIKNISVSGEHNDSGHRRYVGGVVGRNSGAVENATNLMNLTTEEAGMSGSVGAGNDCQMGGIAGMSVGNITNCTNKGVITQRNGGTGSNWGGIVGSGNGRVTDCVNYGKLRGNSKYLGGIAGSGNPQGCENRGEVVIEGLLTSGATREVVPVVGGIVGSGAPKGCTNYSNISSANVLIPLAGITGSGNAESSANYGDISAGGSAAGISGGGASGCRNFGSITAGDAASGISAGGTATDCVNAGAVSGKTASGIAAGGNITACVNYGKITGEDAAGGISAGANSINSTYNVGTITATGGAAKSGGLVADIGNGAAASSYDMTGQSLFGASGASATLANLFCLSGSAQKVTAAGISEKSSGAMILKTVVAKYLGEYNEGQDALSVGKFIWREGAYPALHWQPLDAAVSVSPQGAAFGLLGQDGTERKPAAQAGAGASTYSLLLGELCTYTAQAAGYVAESGTLRADGEPSLYVSLIKDMAAGTKPNPVVLNGTQDGRTSQTAVWRGAGAAQESVQCVPASSYAGDSSFAGAAAKTFAGKQEALPSAGGTQYWNRATLTGLSPQMKYYYRAGRPGAWSDTHSFTTTERKPGGVKFIYMGDVQRSNDAATAEQEYPEWGKLVRSAAAQATGAAFGLFGGDMVESGSDMTDWKYFLSYAQGAFSDMPMYAAAGNHESNFPSSGKPEYMLKLLGLPQNGPDGFKGEFYSFDRGGVHFTVLNSWALSDEQGIYKNKNMSGAVVDEEKLEKLNRWIEEDLAAAGSAKFKVVVMHHPAYPMAEDAVSARVLKQWEPLFVDGGVDLALVGHQHVYGRTQPLAGGRLNTAKGVVYVMGNSGLKYYATGDPKYYPKQIFGIPTYQVVDVSGGALTLKTFDKDGRELDSWSKTSQAADEPRDVNGDNRVDMNDVAEAKSAVLGGEAYDAALDANGDGKVDIRDAQQIQRYVNDAPSGHAAAPSGSFSFGLAAAGAGASASHVESRASAEVVSGGKARITASLTAGGGAFTFYAGQYLIALPAGVTASNIATQNGWECGISQSGGRTVLAFAKLVGDVSGAPCPAYSAIATFDISPPPSLAAGQSFKIECLGSLLTDGAASAVDAKRVSGGGLAFAISGETVALNTVGGTKVAAKAGDTLGRVEKPAKKGYTFKGWYTKAKGGKKLPPSYVVKAGDKIYAQWAVKKFKVTFAPNKGKLKGKRYKTVAYAAKYGKLPTPTRKGYKFTGWHTKAKGGKKITAKSKVLILKNTRIYAQWKKK